VKLLLSLVFPSGWKISYLPRGRQRGLPITIQAPRSNDQEIIRPSKNCSKESLEEKLKKAKKAEVIEVKTEIVN